MLLKIFCITWSVLGFSKIRIDIFCNWHFSALLKNKETDISLQQKNPNLLSQVQNLSEDIYEEELRGWEMNQLKRYWNNAPGLIQVKGW